MVDKNKKVFYNQNTKDEYCYKLNFKFKICKKYLQNNSKRIEFFLPITLQKDVNVSKDNFCNTRIKQLHFSKQPCITGFYS